MKEEGVEPDLVTYNTLVYGLSKVGRVEEARKFLGLMAEMGHFPDTVTYTSLMNGICQKGEALGALALLGEMEERGCSPNSCTYNTLLHGLCKGKLLEKGMELYELMKSNGMKLELASYATFVRALCREERIAEAYEVFDYAVTSKSLTDVAAYSTLEGTLKCAAKNDGEIFETDLRGSRDGIRDGIKFVSENWRHHSRQILHFLWPFIIPRDLYFVRSWQCLSPSRTPPPPTTKHQIPKSFPRKNPKNLNLSLRLVAPVDRLVPLHVHPVRSSRLSVRPCELVALGARFLDVCSRWSSFRRLVSGALPVSGLAVSLPSLRLVAPVSVIAEISRSLSVSIRIGVEAPEGMRCEDWETRLREEWFGDEEICRGKIFATTVAVSAAATTVPVSAAATTVPAPPAATTVSRAQPSRLHVRYPIPRVPNNTVGARSIGWDHAAHGVFFKSF
ncbi:hypothetical protein Syun_028076 [Stephania yunnanensis]|uniref:Pentatricopeptide repeat-containing protein n=1 Tax=Stephania yunnanensis TaxID=152371 RepID=A0AAP0HRU1_9MAGN